MKNRIILLVIVLAFVAVIACAVLYYNNGLKAVKEGNGEDIIVKIEENAFRIKKQDALISFKDSFVVGNIYTNGAIGSVVDLTVNTASTSWRCAVVDCEYLDKFVIKGEGGSNPRLWCFIDSEDKIISQSAASLNPADPITLVAPLSAKKIIVNVTSASYNSASSVFNKYCYVSDVLSIALNNKNEIDYFCKSLCSSVLS